MYELVSLVNEGCADLSDSQSSGGRNGGKGTAVRARRRKPDGAPTRTQDPEGTRNNILEIASEEAVAWRDRTARPDIWPCRRVLC